MPPVTPEFWGDGMGPVDGADTGASDADAAMDRFAEHPSLDEAQDRAGRIRALGAQIARRSAELNRRLA